MVNIISETLITFPPHFSRKQLLRDFLDEKCESKCSFSHFQSDVITIAS